MRKRLGAAIGALLLSLASGACAESADATDEAFGILLAMPGAQPKEGGWVVPQKAAADEMALIARWERLKQQGANFNAMRHRGTLLAHAIRAGKEGAALWLLRNGADPRKVLFDGPEDAHGLALQYKRSAVAAALEAQYGFKPGPGPKPAVPAAAPTREQQSIARLTSNERYTDAAQQEWRRHAATLSQNEFRSLFKDGRHIEELVVLNRSIEGGLEEALARLPLELVRGKAQVIAEQLEQWSNVTYQQYQGNKYTGASLAWPALWRRLDRPLQYGKWPGLAGRIPPSLWPGLFASGYSDHDADATGCLLATADLPTLKTLWPDFQRYFVNAREEAASLVLGAYRLSHLPCSRSEPTETVDKLAFLRANGITGPVHGVRRVLRDPMLDPALAAAMDVLSPKQAVKPRLVRVAPNCELSLDDRWWQALVKTRQVGWGVPLSYVQVVEVPGMVQCSLLVGSHSYGYGEQFSDSFVQGPYREPPVPRYADIPDDGEVWVMERDGIRRVEMGFETRGVLNALRQVRDRESGKRYLLNAGERAPGDLSTWLPHAFEFQAGDKGPKLVPSREGYAVERLLRQQCHLSDDDTDLNCPGLEAREPDLADKARTLDDLRQGEEVPVRHLLEALGTDRRAAYRAALADWDRARLRQLLEIGVPAEWTAAEIRDLAKAGLPLEEKRRRIALLFANAEQLFLAFRFDPYELPKSLASWLPRQDWRPVLRLIAKEPDALFDMAQALRESIGSDLACEVDRAQGFLCGGGVRLD